ncbi:glycosyltransferase family 2 protein [Spirillospora sp. CA-294931]|uniref:glycosyltransferase family 2 protein n=1 Tax=Spirillospora sp. CA-294931 TaxID=3240042 RepID=UPI003D8E3027
MTTPKVSVIVPVYNCRATLDRTFRSVLDQSLPAADVEIIAVDDGSTDGSGEELDRLAAGDARFHVVHQEPSGGPGKPRNVGIEKATGEYVFFLDADDHLGPEALERCCAIADANGTDVVVPKYVGIGRKINPHLFRETVPFTTVYDAVPNLYGSITALKLYRRALLERHRIRFPENVLSGEDQFFAVQAYFEAKGVSVLADYDCYYWVDREDGTSALQTGGAPAADYFPEIRRLMEFVAERTAPGDVRDRLLRRHFAIEVFSRFDPRYQRFTPEERRDTRDAVRDLVREFANPQIMDALSPYMRLLDHALRNNLDDLVDEAAKVHAENPPSIVVADDKALLAYPGLRDERYAVPDEVYELRGSVAGRRNFVDVEWHGPHLKVRVNPSIERLGEGDPPEELLLKHRDTQAIHHVPFLRDGESLVAEIDFGDPALTPGRWDTSTLVRTRGYTHEARLYASDDARVPGARLVATAEGAPFAEPYLTKHTGALALNIGAFAKARTPAGPPKITPSGPALHLQGHLAAALPPTDLTVSAVLQHRETDDTVEVDLTIERAEGKIKVSGEFDLSNARRGKWDLSYKVTTGESTGTLRTPAPTDLGRPTRSVKPFRTAHGNLSIQTTKSRLRSLLRR